MTPLSLGPDIAIHLYSHKGRIGTLAFYFADLDRAGIVSGNDLYQHVARLLGGYYGVVDKDLAALKKQLDGSGQRSSFQMPLNLAIALPPDPGKKPIDNGVNMAELQEDIKKLRDARDKAARDCINAQQELERERKRTADARQGEAKTLARIQQDATAIAGLQTSLEQVKLELAAAREQLDAAREEIKQQTALAEQYRKAWEECDNEHQEEGGVGAGLLDPWSARRPDDDY